MSSLLEVLLVDPGHASGACPQFSPVALLLLLVGPYADPAATTMQLCRWGTFSSGVPSLPIRNANEAIRAVIQVEVKAQPHREASVELQVTVRAWLAGVDCSRQVMRPALARACDFQRERRARTLGRSQCPLKL
jgi:hypothetical protein